MLLTGFAVWREPGSDRLPEAHLGSGVRCLGSCSDAVFQGLGIEGFGLKEREFTV